MCKSSQNIRFVNLKLLSTHLFPLALEFSHLIYYLLESVPDCGGSNILGELLSSTDRNAALWRAASTNVLVAWEYRSLQRISDLRLSLLPSALLVILSLFRFEL